ncbi:MAG: Gfo/Idh/MocA family oxidoreductase [Chloroflexaceae bacterium]|nr:Gfo/Idh/MocA family oxidoreductase [Chloroflexaceae bacterium]
MAREKHSGQVGVAFFGFGYWGANYVRIFRELPDSWDVVLCDVRPERLQEARKRFPGVSLTTHVDEALDMEGVHAAVISTQAQHHHDVARKCLEAGKHVLIEKPITLTSEHAQDLINLAESKKLVLMVGHTFLYNPAVRKVKEYIDQSELGRLYYMYSSRTNLGPVRKDVNALWDLATHDVSIFNYFMGGPPQWVSATGAKLLRSQQEDVGFVTLGYANEVVGHIHVSWADPNKVREVVVVGSDKRVVFDDLNALERVRIYEKGITSTVDDSSSYGEFYFTMRDGDIISPRIEVSEPLKNQCIHFLDCVKHNTRPFTDGQAGLDVVRVMEAIDRSMHEKSTVDVV